MPSWSIASRTIGVEETTACRCASLALQRLFRQLAVGDIDVQAEHSHRLALLVEQQRRRARGLSGTIRRGGAAGTPSRNWMSGFQNRHQRERVPALASSGCRPAAPLELGWIVSSFSRNRAGVSIPASSRLPASANPSPTSRRSQRAAPAAAVLPPRAAPPIACTRSVTSMPMPHAAHPGILTRSEMFDHAIVSLAAIFAAHCHSQLGVVVPCAANCCCPISAR